MVLPAEPSDEDSGADLLFVLSEDERSLVVRRVPPSGPARYRDWTLEAEAFGPDAWFDLEPTEYAQWDTAAQATKTKDGAPRRYIVVRGASWGRRVADDRGQPLDMTFVFERPAAKPWTVGLDTNVWSSPIKNPAFHTEPENRKPLHVFIVNRSTLVEVLSKGRIQSALDAMLDGQVLVGDQMTVGFNADVEWILEPVGHGGRPLAAFDGRVEAPAAAAGSDEPAVLTVRWERRQDDDPARTVRRLTARCPALWRSPFQVAGNGDMPSVAIMPPGGKPDATGFGELFVGQLDPQSRVVSEGGFNSASVIALFSTPGAVLDCRLRGTGGEAVLPVCTGVPLDDVTLTRIMTGEAEGGWRDVVVADAGGKRSAPASGGSAPPAGSAPKAADLPPVPPAPPKPVGIATLIGRMEVAALPVDTAAVANQAEEADAGLKARRKFEAVSAAAIGDRGGISERTFFLVVDRSRGADKEGTGKRKGVAEATDILRRLYADVALYGFDAALPDTRDSTLTVSGSHFRFNYVDGEKLPGLVLKEIQWSTPDGYLWLGAPPLTGEFAWLDLGGSRLHARRDHDLVDVRFRFRNLVLGFSLFSENGVPAGITRMLRPSQPDARQSVVRRRLNDADGTEGGDGKFEPADETDDRRPILAVEFPPQHVMEEAFFRQELGPLPDTRWPDDKRNIESFLEALRNEPDEGKRAAARKEIGEAKVALEAAQSQPSDPKPFAELRTLLLGAKNLPADQQQYFGPYAMSSQAIKLAREWQSAGSDAFLKPIVAAMLSKAGDVQPPNVASWTLPDLLKAEEEAEKVYPLYKLWRDAFRAYVVETRGETAAAAGADAGNSLLDNTFAEYVNRNRKPDPPGDYLPSTDLENQFTNAFLKQISGREPYDRLAMARLSGRSLLAFRVNFEAAPGDSAEVNGLPDLAPDSPAAPGPGVQRFGPMEFTFAALTDWSRHEPYVTQRARKLYEPLASGALPPVAGRVASIDDHAILVQQGFEPGAKPSEQHLGQVQENLKKRPKGLETQIEIPSRLVLSTAQNAIWQSPRKVSRKVPEGAADVFDTDPVPSGTTVDYEAYEPLWTARLIVEDAEPGLRAVWSPDMRPQAIGIIGAGGGVQRIAGPPPRGPWAPWILRREQVDGVRPAPAAVKKAEKAAKPTSADAPTPSGAQEAEETDEQACPVPPPDIQFESNPTPTMFERICEIFRLRVRYNNQADLHSFRTSLDAYDRHELVLLSSAYGLPVTGRRRQIGNSDTDAGELIEKSGQFEPGEDFHLTDATSDLAYYRPKPLDVSELSLSALGGFLNHDTNFVPPAAAVTYDGRAMFDGLSIERWQHLIVLGRDVLATAVYSGYLFPLGHKASLVKITERIFVRMKGDAAKDKDFGVKAVLRQRMFVRISTPSKKFPAVGQPNKGRQWCAEEVTMLTRETPDIVDPTLELEPPPSGASLGGRISLGGPPGLVFWPQTAMTEQARFRFEFMLDGRRTKMPLIFVDRIAATNKTALNALLTYYKGLSETEWRTAVLGGQALRFADSVKEGDTSFATDGIVLDVDGRASSDGQIWEGQNDLLVNTGVLEGADQPPFYPAMSSADIHIEQAETMSGAAIGAVRVRFDGSYVRSGFAPRQIEQGQNASNKSQAAETLAGNAAEVFLYVDLPAPPKMSMGPNGNQSGGVGRPNMDIVALSRSKGILGAQPGQGIYQYGPSGNLKQPYKASPAPLLSVAKHFSLPPPPQQASQGDGGQPPVPAASEQDTSAVLQDFFSADAKLLGVISFKTVMKLLKLAGGVDEMPALKEVVDYGSQALAQLDKGVTGAIEVLHGEVLAPLLQLVRAARKEWSKLDGRQLGAQASVVGQFQDILPDFQATSLRTLYPEIDRGLDKLETALLEAMGETDAVVMLGRLAAVREAGRQFMRELARLAANPVERIEQAARGQFENIAGSIQAQIKTYEEGAAAFVAALQAMKADVARELAKYLVAELPWDEVAAILQAAEQGTTLSDLAGKTIDGLQKVDVNLSDELAGLANGSLDPAATLKKIVEKVADGAIAAAEEVEKDPLGEVKLELPATTEAKEMLRAAVKLYKLRLADAKSAAAAWIDGAVPPPEWATWVERLRAALQLIKLVQELVKSDRPERVFPLLVQLGRDYLGVDLAGIRTGIENDIKAQEAQFREWVNAILGRLVAVAAGAAAESVKIDPRLSARAVELCVAQLPVADNGKTGAAEANAEAVDAEIDKAHFLKGFAESVVDSFDLSRKLTDARDKLPAGKDGDKVRTAIDDFRKALPAYRRLFCEVVAIVGRAQAAHDELTNLSQGQGNPPVMTAEAMLDAADRLRVLAKEIEQGLRRIRTAAKEVFELLRDHLEVIAAAAAGGAFDAAFGDDVKDALKAWDQSAAAALRVALNTLFRWTRVVETVARQAVSGILDLGAAAVRKWVPNVLRTERDALAVSLELLDDDCGALAGKIGNLILPPAPTSPPFETVTQLLDAKLEGYPATVRELFEGEGGIARTDKIEAALRHVSTSYAALLARAKGLPESLAGETLDKPAQTLFGALQAGYKEILDLRNQIVAKVQDSSIAGAKIKNALLVEPLGGGCDPLKIDCDKLAEEKAAIEGLLKPTPPLTEPRIVSTKRKELQAFLDSISGGRSAIDQILAKIQDIWDDISRGELAALVDIAALRDQVEELISKLVPVRRTLTYALDFEFDGDKIAKLTGGVFVPQPPSRFELAMTATIDLLKAAVEMKAKGRIGPFNIQLIGDVFNAVTLIFDGVDFGFELGGSPRFDVHYRDFQIGEKLEFVKQLQSYMTPSKDGSGFFIEPMRGKPGIVAGYGINLGTIQLGGVAFSNILLNAAAELPFDGEAALFRFALGRPLAPFLISVPPYGGGGFVAIYADAQGFRGFEASFEFGGVADFSTGPLTARGRLTSGFYIRSLQVEVEGRRRTLTDIYGTFFVGGEASIWIFSFYASLYVRLGMRSGGEMEGEATFTFSFSMGIVDYDFQVSVSHKREAFGSEKTASIIGGSSADDDAPQGVDRSLVTRTIAGDAQAPAKATAPNIDARTTSLGEATVADYLAYFDLALLETETSK